MTTENTRHDNNNWDHLMILKFDQKNFINKDSLPFNCLPLITQSPDIHQRIGLSMFSLAITMCDIHHRDSPVSWF